VQGPALFVLRSRKLIWAKHVMGETCRITEEIYLFINLSMGYLIRLPLTKAV